MAQASPMQMMVSIVERGRGTGLTAQYRQFKIFNHIQTVGRGTAASSLMNTLGFGTTERDIILSIAPRDTVRQLMNYLKDDDRPNLDAQGIAFSLPITGMTAILAVLLSRAEEMDPERGDIIMEQDNHHHLILVTVNQGYTDAVMNTARAAGARGGTIVRARWTGAETAEQFMGITLQSEKEIIAMVVHTKDRDRIMDDINRIHGLKAAPQAVVVSIPIEHTARLD